LFLAWAVCLGILGAGEAALHVAPASWMMGYDQRSIELTQSADYINMRRVVASMPPPQVCIIGSSRARAILSAPTIRRILSERGFADADVRVYAGPNFNAAACLALLRLMQDCNHVPPLIIYAVDPRQLADCLGRRGAYATWLCDLPTALRPNNPIQVMDYPAVKSIVSTSADLRVRSLWLREFVRLQPPVKAQALGGYSGDQVGHMMEKEENSMISHSANDSDLLYEMWIYDCEARREPSSMQRLYTQRALDVMRDIADSAVLELPMPEITIRAFRAGYLDQVASLYSDECAKRGIPFIRASDVGFAAEDRYYSNATHANWTGANAYSKMLAEKVILPSLQRQQAKATLAKIK
jgi:hypothetical protein